MIYEMDRFENMKKVNTWNIVLVFAVVVLVVTVALLVRHSAASSGDAVMKCILTRTSIRAYQDRPVEDEKVEQLLRAAMAAPTAGNKQPWRFVVIEDRQTLKEISAHFQTMKMAEHAPLAIVVCGDMDNTFPEDGKDYWVEDASAASENLLLAAHALGLGAVWCGVYPMQERVYYLKKLLHLPANIVPLNVIPVGYPEGDATPKDKWKPTYVHYEHWNGRKLR